MSTCYTWNDKTYYADELISEAIEEIKKYPLKYKTLMSTVFKEFTPQGEVVSLLEKIESSSKGKSLASDYMGVNRYIDLERRDSGLSVPVRLSPIYNEENRINEYIKQEVLRTGVSEEDARTSILATIEDEKLAIDIGTIIHKFTELGFKYGISSQEFEAYKAEAAETLTKEVNGRTLFDLITESYEGTTTPQDVVNQMSQTARVLIRKLKKLHPGAQFFPEFEMTSDNAVFQKELPMLAGMKGIVGKADLIVVDSTGKLFIYDLKTSCRHFGNNGDGWYMAKLNHTDYLLGFYRQILADRGVKNISSAQLVIQPIYFDRKNLPDTLLIEEANIRTRASYNKDRLNFYSGSFTRNINELLPIATTYEAPSNVDMQDKISEDFNAIMPAYGQVRLMDKQDIIDRRVSADHSKDNKVRYKFYNEIKDVWEYRDTLEEFSKEGGVIDQYIQDYQNYNSSRVLTIIDTIKEYQLNGTDESEMDFLGGKKAFNPKVPIALKHVFGRYCDPSFKILEIPELIDNNIIAFERNGIVEFVYLSQNRVDSLCSLNGQSTVLAKFYSNDETKTILGVKVLDSQYGNIELIKVMSIINSLINSDPDNFLKGKQIGFIETINPEQGEPWPQNIDVVKLNFSLLCLKAGIKNSISSQDMADPFDFMLSEIRIIVQGLDKDNQLKQILTSIAIDLATLAEKKKVLKKLLMELRSYDPTLKSVDYTSKRTYDETKPSHRAYVLTVAAINALHGFDITPEGTYSKYGLHISEIIKLLSMPFVKDQANVTTTGEVSAGVLQGLYMSSPQTVKSEVLRHLYKYYDASYLQVRDKYLKLRIGIQAITKKYIALKKGITYRLLYNDLTSIWENLLVKDADGKVSSDLLLKNPYDNTVYLEETDRQFLKEILWEINKYQLNLDEKYGDWSYAEKAKEIDALQEVIQAKHNGSYFYLPLRRASHFAKLKSVLKTDIKVTDAFKSWWENIKDEYDPRLLHNHLVNTIRREMDLDSLKMYNQYLLNTSERNKYIENVNNPYEFSFDLDLLASDVAFLSIRKRFFEDVLVVTETVAAAYHIMGNNGGKVNELILSALADQTDVSIKNKQIYKEEYLDVVKVASIAKRFNGVMVLAFRPLLFIKEITFGKFTNISRALSLTGSNLISIRSLFEADKVIWGLSMRKYGKAFAGEGDIADFTMCSALNKVYGFANEDLNRLVENSTLSANGITGNYSRWMYIANSAPDYFNRLALFIAKMVEDKCWEAHTLDKDGNLVYDFNKDGRFDKLRKLGLNSSSKDKEYLDLKGLYYAMVEEFEQEGYNLKKWNKETKSFELVPLPRAYTTSQRNSIKEVADLAYGFYDHEAKSLIDHLVFGLVWKLFMTFWTGKTTLWFRGRPKTLGDNTSLGRFVKKKTSDGKQVYKQLLIDSEGNLVGSREITEDNFGELTQEEIDNLEVVYVWQGDYVEGLMYSVLGTLYDIFHFNFKEIANNKYRLGNLKLALHDVLMGLILYTLLKWIFSSGTNKMKDIHPTGRILLRAMQDVGPQSIGQLKFEPGFVNTLENVLHDIFKLFDPDVEFLKTISKRVAAFKDWTWEHD